MSRRSEIYWQILSLYVSFGVAVGALAADAAGDLMTGIVAGMAWPVYMVWMIAEFAAEQGVEGFML